MLYPSILLGWVLWRGWRDLQRPSVFLAHVVCLSAMGIRYALEKLGQPGYFETMQAQRPYIGLIFDLRGAWMAYAPLLIAPERLIWTLGGIAAVLVALIALRNMRLRVADLPRDQQATLFFASQFIFVLVVILTLVGTAWREARYLLLVQPFWLLVGAAGVIWLQDRLIHHQARRGISLTLLTVFIFATSLQPALTAINQQVEGYDLALGYLSSARKSPPDANEVVMSPQPPACALVLGRCDYYAVQRDYEEFVIKRNNVLIDRWTGSQLLHTTAQLQTVLRRPTQPSVPTWFVTDSFRLATRYEPDFVRTVIEQFDLAYQARGVMVLRADGWRELPKPQVTKDLVPPLLFSPLGLTRWERDDAKPGADLHLTLFWQATQTISQQFNTSVRLVAADGKILAQQDGPPARGLIPTNLFFATPTPDLKTLTIPEPLAPGRYRLDISVYDVTTLTPVTPPQAFDWFTVGPPLVAPQQKIGAQAFNGLQLIGADNLPTTIHAGETLNVRLVWSTIAALAHDYTVFVHLVGADGKPIAQSDRAPENGFYPTSGWHVGEWVQDQYTLAVPAIIPPGNYQLLVGLYRPDDNSRLLFANGKDTIVLATWGVGAK